MQVQGPLRVCPTAGNVGHIMETLRFSDRLSVRRIKPCVYINEGGRGPANKRKNQRGPEPSSVAGLTVVGRSCKVLSCYTFTFILFVYRNRNSVCAPKSLLQSKGPIHFGYIFF